MSEARRLPGCWCGYPTLFPYSDEYDVCKHCGTLVSRALKAERSSSSAANLGIYTEEYWLKRQREHHHLPDIHARARLDLPERCTHWLQHLLRVQLPPARVLELGCGHGGYLALLKWAGFAAMGTEMSPWVVDLARTTFGVDVRAGTVEEQEFEPGSFDVIVLNDVLEHLEHPKKTLEACARLLSPNGFFVTQTPEYKEHLSYREVVQTGDIFIRHMAGNNEEHLYLYSRRSVQHLFESQGFPTLAFSSPVYSYDMYFTASRVPLPEHSGERIWNALSKRPEGRLVQALLDKAYESTDRWWALQRAQERRGG